jgi:hypothetical protein
MNRAQARLSRNDGPDFGAPQATDRKMSTPPNRTATARQDSTGRAIAPGDARESTHVRRLPTENRTGKPHLSAVERESVPAVSEHDTIPCGPPTAEEPTRPNDLERTLRFARLVHETLASDHSLTRMLELALMRRDGALLRAILKELHKQQTADAVDDDDDDDEIERRSDRYTLLPPPPEQT